MNPSLGGGYVATWEINPSLPSYLVVEVGKTFSNFKRNYFRNSKCKSDSNHIHNLGKQYRWISIHSNQCNNQGEPIAVFSYSPSTVVFTRGMNITDMNPTLGGGYVATWEISPSLPFGLTLSNGVISGTPSVNLTQTTYTIWANNTGGSASTTINVTINEPIAIFSYSPSTVVFTRGMNITDMNPTLGGGYVATWEITPFYHPA